MAPMKQLVEDEETEAKAYRYVRTGTKPLLLGLHLRLRRVVARIPGPQSHMRWQPEGLTRPHW